MTFGGILLCGGAAFVFLILNLEVLWKLCIYKKQWDSWTYLPYYKNVERDKIVIL